MFAILITLLTVNTVPIKMTHQDVTDANGPAKPVCYSHLYDAETGGSSQWTETLAVQFATGFITIRSDEQNNPLDSGVLSIVSGAVDECTTILRLVSISYSQILIYQKRL